MVRGLVVAAAVVGICGVARAGDPSGGWLTYAVYQSPSATDTVTRLSARMVVPPEIEDPRMGMPAFWFGVQTAAGDGALIQPIMSKWLGSGYYMFQEIFDWTDENDKQSDSILVKPGESIWAEVSFVEATRSYRMNMTSSSGKVSNFHYALLPAQKATEAAAYFVLEHQPFNGDCKGLPPSGQVRWTDIAVEVNGKKVANPEWQAKEESPVCGAKTVVVNSTAIDITWTPAT